MRKKASGFGLRGVQMTHEEILERITVLMRNLTDDDALVLTDETTPDDVDLWDSILHLKLILQIESAFNIRFEMTEIDEPENVGRIVKQIEAKLAA